MFLLATDGANKLNTKGVRKNSHTQEASLLYTAESQLLICMQI